MRDKSRKAFACPFIRSTVRNLGAGQSKDDCTGEKESQIISNEEAKVASTFQTQGLAIPAIALFVNDELLTKRSAVFP
ncbi:MAG: hypothetical protein JST61_17015 [Acidobacteria bacterium]|nr:hypothetical protein [Acidobacteriota bacterium]